MNKNRFELNLNSRLIPISMKSISRQKSIFWMSFTKIIILKISDLLVIILSFDLFANKLSDEKLSN